MAVYRSIKPGEPEIIEAEAVPAHPDNEYGWEEFYPERMGMAYARHYLMAVRIPRFQNCHQPDGTRTSGQEKSPAAMRRKVAEAGVGGTIER